MTAQQKAENLVEALEQFLDWKATPAVNRGDDWPLVWLTEKIAENLKDDPT
jgi:hypothetical protein